MRIAAVCVNVVISGVVIDMLLTVLRNFTCQRFLFSVVYPFILTELWDSFTVGLILLWIRYQLFNSCGKELPQVQSPGHRIA